MNNIWDEVKKELEADRIFIAFDENGCNPVSLTHYPIAQFVEQNFSPKVKFYDATIFLLMMCKSEDFWNFLRMLDTTIILICYDISVENLKKAKEFLPLNEAFLGTVGYPFYGNAILLGEKDLPQNLLAKVQKLEDVKDSGF